MPYKYLKIKAGTYEKLKSIMDPSETFDNAINRLLELQKKVEELEREIKTYEEVLKEIQLKRETEVIRLDKTAWYITKMIFSVQALKDLVLEGQNGDKVKRQLLRLERVLNQIKSRYNVETEELLEVAKQFVESKDKEDLILLNEATKEIVKSIIIVMLGVEVKRAIPRSDNQ